MDLNSKENFWDTKPYWCQPWSIISFGISFIVFSWILFHNVIIASIVSFIIIIWWIVFLILTPNLYQQISEKK